MKSDVCAGIVTFNPNIERLQENIESIVKQVDELIICDNASNNLSAIKKIIDNKKIQIIELSVNKGIASALNIICNMAFEKGYIWVLTLDQDSVSPYNLIEELLKYSNKKTIGIAAPDLEYRNNENYSKTHVNEFDKTKWVITSASLTNLSAWKAVNGFDDKLFIDKVDYDFCVRIRAKGFDVIRVNTVKLMHELGNLKCKKIFGRVIYVTNHSGLRCYYMTRNNLILKKKLGVGKPAIENLKLVVKVLLFEANKGEKLKAIFKGIKDYKDYFS